MHRIDGCWGRMRDAAHSTLGEPVPPAVPHSRANTPAYLPYTFKMWWRGLVYVAAAVALVACTPSGPGIIKLGTYDYFTDESTPVTFNGRLLMFESIVHASPQWAGYWIPAFANCACYFRVRDLYSGAGGWTRMCMDVCVCMCVLHVRWYADADLRTSRVHTVSP
jgi:hypothetical protein